MKKISAFLVTAVGSIAIYETLKRYGIIDQINGKIEQAVGKSTDDPGLQIKGMFTSGKGKVKEAFEDTKDAFEDAVEDFNHSYDED